jgi:hypothetical protein
MSSVPLSAVPRAVQAPREIRVVRHSSLFYWWPVWAVGFVMAALTAASDYRLAVVPKGSTVQLNQEVAINGVKGTHDIVVLPENRHWLEIDKGTGQPIPPHLYMSRSKNLGVLFCIVLLLVIAITNIVMRGLWSVIVIMLIISISIILGLMDAWERILESLSFLDIRINMGGYLLIASVLLVLWLIVTFLFDKQMYMVFTPGQLRVRLEIGESETAYDTAGMTIQKQRSDLFRHWILGFGSGDLIVRTSGAQAHTFDMPNVLFLGRRVREIEDMMRSRAVVSSQP